MSRLLLHHYRLREIMRPKHECVKLITEIDTALRTNDHQLWMSCMSELSHLRPQLTEQEKSVVDVYAQAKAHYRNK